ncbi:2-dehydro-3-deoxy-6-phosphogalactonate aldolase [Lysobacter sp. BMK333-48F3]|uniref:2-dehydro-3-deoxy-6-phosphogalactonate aldolase n=1 Tax=Lysobacter sp. BMK333-48F3 TaxID=2867962 RepID=UPI001C8C8B3D|nr:2-dehydro-3-deoxy-6-phosphogalactonate aldolase [Lysobacter sp. BMK333-48F3]MBX9400475.1 2-dehydro-3-deoxy-6-phosphogalactonate aldolase [Lysobacter sp. BMK333-48F3]
MNLDLRTSSLPPLRTWLEHSPFVAILRGITPEEALDVGAALVGAGWRLIEVPLNSPGAFDSIARLQRRYGDEILLGAGTVRRTQEVDELARVGARLMVCPHTDPTLIRYAKRLGLLALPGAATPSECLTALDAGADALKLFPADALGPAMLAASRAVLPADTAVLPVGGIHIDLLAIWRKAGATGFGIGGTLYRPGRSAAQVAQIARGFNQAWRETEAARRAPR